MLLDTDVKLKQSATHNGADSGSTGGAKSSTVITNATVGEWFPRFRAPLSGALYDDSVRQYQKVFVDNESSSDDLLSTFIYLYNGLSEPTGPGIVTFVCTDADDYDGDKKVIVSGDNQLGGILDKETVILDSASKDGGKNWNRLFRCKLVDTSTGLVVTADQDIEIQLNGSRIGMIPEGYSYAVYGLKIWVPSTTDESGTTTSRLTSPSGSSFSRATDLASAIPVRNDSGDNNLNHGEAQGVWGEFELQPGEEPDNAIELVLAAHGDGT